jgi:molybdopterin/thiamine biosynthesis adenylyltransferase
VGVAGLGALGSAAVFALAQLTRASGTLELVDDDHLSPTNLERVLTAEARDVGRSKVDLARRALRPTRLRSVGIGGRYGPELPHRARASTILVGVDSGAARRQIVRFLPEALYNGGTQSSELLVSRHVRFQGACLECLYPKPFQSPHEAGAQACARAVVAEELPQATIGFVSALCGFLMACELVKDRLHLERDHALDDARPVLRLDLLAGAPGPECIESYVPRRDCFCREPDTQRRIDALRGG